MVQQAVRNKQQQGNQMAKATHKELIASRDKLAAKLHEIFGDTGYYTHKSQPKGQLKDRVWRFATGYGQDKLAVRVQMNAEEWARRDKPIFAGKTLTEFMFLIPREFDGFLVDVRALGPVIAHAG